MFELERGETDVTFRRSLPANFAEKLLNVQEKHSKHFLVDGGKKYRVIK